MNCSRPSHNHERESLRRQHDLPVKSRSLSGGSPTGPSAPGYGRNGKNPGLRIARQNITCSCFALTRWRRSINPATAAFQLRHRRRPRTASPQRTRRESAPAVVDASNVTATFEFVRILRNQPYTVNLLVPALGDSITFALLRLEVKGFLTYPQTLRERCRAAHQVCSGGYWVPRELLTRFVESILPEQQGCKSLESEADISRREREVLHLLLDDLSNREIASKLFVCERTVKFHSSNLLSKLGVQRRADLMVLWMQRTTTFSRLSRDLGRSISAHVN